MSPGTLQRGLCMKKQAILSNTKSKYKHRMILIPKCRHIILFGKRGKVRKYIREQEKMDRDQQGQQYRINDETVLIERFLPFRKK